MPPNKGITLSLVPSFVHAGYVLPVLLRIVRLEWRKDGVQSGRYLLINHSLLKIQLTLLVVSISATSIPRCSNHARCFLITAGSALSYPPPTGCISRD